MQKLKSILRTPDWQKNAICNDIDPELWFYEPMYSEHDIAEQSMRTQIAISYCNRCPVRRECLEMGLEDENMHAGSIWGGLMFPERLELKGRRRKYSSRREGSMVRRVRSKVAKIS